MASGKSGNSSNSLPSNVRIKTEAGTSMPVPLTSIKTEPGLPSTTRLTSFRLPRDLTLGATIKTEKSKKVYTPNLNAQRAKKKEESVQNDSTKSARGRDHNRGRGRGSTDRGRDRGRGRGSSNLIQSSGVWSTGITATTGRKSGGGYRDTDRDSKSTTSHLERPKLDLNRIINKAEEEEKIKLLLKDDFVDDGEPMNIDNGPVILPMIKEAKIYKDVKDIKIKVEEDETEEKDKKPIILENGEAIPPKAEPKVKILKSDIGVKDEVYDIPKIVENKTNSYILIQFPDCLPGLVSSGDDVRPTRSNATNYEKENDDKSKPELCTLNNLKSGILGKLQILKSGKTRLLLGENNLTVDVGSHLSFRQDLIAAKVDTENLNGDLINLGPVNSTLICSPDWESMLAKL